MNAGEARDAVIARDRRCMAGPLDPRSGLCYDKWGREVFPWATMFNGLEVDRVRDRPTMGKAPEHGDPDHMVALCPGHHRGTGPQNGYIWATANRPLLRAYLERVTK